MQMKSKEILAAAEFRGYRVFMYGRSRELNCLHLLTKSIFSHKFIII